MTEPAEDSTQTLPAEPIAEAAPTPEPEAAPPPPSVTYHDATHRTALCPSCQQPFEQERLPAFDLWFPAICQPCDAKAERMRAVTAAMGIRKRREATITEEIPPRYVALSNDLLQGRLTPANGRFPADVWKMLESWYPAETNGDSMLPTVGRGLIIAGDTGRFKTTMAAALLARTHRVMGLSICYFNASEFGEAVQDKQAWKDDPALRNRARAKLDKARTAGLLLIDDLGKEQSTVTIYKQLKHLIEERTAHFRPTIVTTQLTAAELAAAIGQSDADTGRALIRRLQDYCDLFVIR